MDKLSTVPILLSEIKRFSSRFPVPKKQDMSLEKKPLTFRTYRKAPHEPMHKSILCIIMLHILFAKTVQAQTSQIPYPYKHLRDTEEMIWRVLR
jgi:hypothetical protein